MRPTNCGFDFNGLANVEKAECPPPGGAGAAPPGAGPSRKVATPGKRTIGEVSEFLGIDPASLIKTLLFETSAGDVAVLVSGAYDVNEVKVKNHLGADWVRLAGEDRVRELSGAPSGFAGPVGLSVRTIADHSVRAIAAGATGANERDAHLVDVVPGRDFVPEAYADLRSVSGKDPCPRCGAALRFSRGIEVGHVFRLGTKYSEAFSFQKSHDGMKVTLHYEERRPIYGNLEFIATFDHEVDIPGK